METRKTPNYSLPLWICTVLLSILLILNTYTVIDMQVQRAGAREAAEARAAVKAGARAVAQAHLEIIEDLFDKYEDTAYGDDVDRITEQQLIAAEFQLVTLQMIAKQNVELIELLASLE